MIWTLAKNVAGGNQRHKFLRHAVQKFFRGFIVCAFRGGALAISKER